MEITRPSPSDERSEAEQLQRALDLSYAQLNRRDCTVSEIRRRLQRSGVSAAVMESAIQTLTDQGLLDDERFTRLFISDKRRLEQWGADRIRRGLIARGIDADVAHAALASEPEDAEEGESELSRALAVLRQRFPAPPADPRTRERALAVLLRKGYDSEVALDALAAHARAD